MVLTLTVEGCHAQDISFLLHKHPDTVQAVEIAVGKAHIFYPEYSKEKATIALLLDIDPVNMVRNAKTLVGKDFALGQYVNDRPYVASSFMSAAIAKAFSSALNGNCKERPELVETPLNLTAVISVLPAVRGRLADKDGEKLIRRLFEPLGYGVSAQQHLLDTQFTGWGYSDYFTVTLKNNITVKTLLSHLYVLIPVLDNEKHYFITQSEVDKLLQKGKGWLEHHPEKELIVARYLINVKSFMRSAFAVLDAQTALNKVEDFTDSAHARSIPSVQKEKQERLHEKRLQLVSETIKNTGAKSLIDLGCGDGKLLKLVLNETQFERIAATDVSYTELVKCKERLNWENLPQRQQERLSLFQSSILYHDKRFYGFDAAALVEVIEHIDEKRLPSFEKAIFRYAKPKTVVLTTPNSEYNVHYRHLEEKKLRHTDHRFEWDRHTFQTWAHRIAACYNYTVCFFPVGEEDSQTGAPCQMAVFTLWN